ncbi:MAG: hypothetical protein KDD47_26865, partial [Acidobacteria bacterium]|nr:hypothetical protein [Acidobacteriota bacterium]
MSTRGTESPAPSQGRLLSNLVHFARLLRDLGLAVTPDRLELLLAAVEAVDLRQRRQVKDACRAVLVDRREDLAIFEQAFDLFWRPGIAGAGARIELGELLRRSTQVKRRLVSQLFDAPQEPGGEDGEAEPVELVDRRQSASRREVLSIKDFAELTAEEEQELRKLLLQQIVPVGQRLSRRTMEAPRGKRLDLRRTLRRNLVRGGELLDLSR